MENSAVTTDNTIIEFRNVHKHFGKQHVLRGLNLKIPRQKITVIIGRSGEGKSVTIKHIVGLLHPDAGEVWVDGVNMTHASLNAWIAVRKKIGILFQDGALLDSLLVKDNVAFPLREFTNLTEKEIDAEVSRLLALVGVADKKNYYPSELSIGEKKRVGLARALALKPKVLLYDEPTTSMDPLISELIDNLIVDMQKQFPDLTSVVISHDVRSISTIAEYIVLLHEGKVYKEGLREEFLRTTDPLIIQFLTGSREGPLRKILT